MAEIFPDEGLDKIQGVFPKNGTNPTELFLGLFTSQTNSTVPARGATGGASPSGWTEATGTGYARVSVPAGNWGAPATEGNGRKITASQVTMPTAGAGGWGTANGFFLATHASSQAGDTIIYFANFDDLVAVAIAENDIVKVTPSMRFDG